MKEENPLPRLVMFDIDGTLTSTVKVDEECFVRSMAEVCGFDNVDTDWSRYNHATDSSIFEEVYESRTGRSPSRAQVQRFREHFVNLIGRASSKSAFVPIPGASRVLSQLARSGEHRISLATGTWRDSARVKMASAGLCFDNYPSACADDALERESIMRLSLRRAAERYGEIGSTVYVGDGVWDARACRNLDIPFIGIATDGLATRLLHEGAIRVFPDFTDADLFLKTLDEIAIMA